MYSAHLCVWPLSNTDQQFQCLFEPVGDVVHFQYVLLDVCSESNQSEQLEAEFVDGFDLPVVGFIDVEEFRLLESEASSRLRMRCLSSS